MRIIINTFLLLLLVQIVTAQQLNKPTLAPKTSEGKNNANGRDDKLRQKLREQSISQNPMLQKPLPEAYIIPLPHSIEMQEGYYMISPRTRIVVSYKDKEAYDIAGSISKRFFNINGFIITMLDADTMKVIPGETIYFQRNSSLGKEAYTLSVRNDRVQIAGGDGAGLFYAVQTLYQLLPPEIFTTQRSKRMAAWRLSACEISDEPRFAWRGMHLDVSRHFFSIDFIKQYLDLMAMHKLNTFHWHLTDDQGWRIEIKKYPKLTEIGSIRKESMIGHYNENRFDGTTYGGYYTQDQIKEIVKYAQERYITVVPEIEMPGHASAAIAAYPELGCGNPGLENTVATKWGVFENVFCPTETTFDFMENVLTEVMDLFPSQYIHIGGDEVPKKTWENNDFCKNLMKKENLKDAHALQSYFIKRIEKFVNKKGRSIIGWDEILEGGLAPNAAVMSWRGNAGGIAAAKENHYVVMTPGSHCYFDHYQADPSNEPIAIGGYTTLEKVYGYEPIPSELKSEQAKYILGAQGNLWTEYISTPEQATYMAYPRGAALAEVLWSEKKDKDYEKFIHRLGQHLKRFDIMGINYAKHIYNVNSILLKDGDVFKVKLVGRKGIIRYTTDGSEPIALSTLYNSPITIDKTTTIKAALFVNNKAMSNALEKTYYINPLTGLKYSLINQSSTYTGGSDYGLTNGIKGDTQNWDTWVGFNGTDMEASFDLQQKKNFNKVSFNAFNNWDSWILLPESVTLSTSDDGINYSEIKSIDINNNNHEKQSIEAINIELPKGFETRYLRITAKNKGKCPQGHPGEGNDCWLFIDEITIE